MNETLKQDALLSIMVAIMGILSEVEIFWYKVVLIVLAIGCVALRYYLKSKEEFRK